MANYQIKMTPVEYYFFGGEKHNEDLTTNYFVESNDYPQQTTLLGLLRYFLLQKNKLLGGKNLPKEKQEEAGKNIGEQSFDFNSIANTFGKIISLSPLYFNDSKNNFFFAPLDIQFEISNNFILSDKENKTYTTKKHGNLIAQYLISEDSKEIIELSKIIKNISQVGNEKGDKGETKENAFYKQTMKQLAGGWSFVIDADINEEIDENEDYFLPFGGEKCFFKLNFKKQEAFSPTYPSSHSRNVFSILCLSDCFTDGSKIKDLEFAVNNYVSYRNLRSKLSTQNFNSLKKDNEMEQGIKRSERYQLLQRGSVLYFSDVEKGKLFAGNLKNTNGSSIGFNHIITNQK
ncbi:MAG TPA: type III-B CRISPR module-associated Cmr3 family protein [Chitinophagales bacterium]|nr:type III-B CRISPR module-associated Cmr3 family protein [Chitinophagales bacterium]